MKTIIHSLAALFLVIASASAGTVSKVTTDAQNATIDAKLNAGEELRVFVGEESLGWSAAVGIPSVVQAKVQASDAVPLDDGGKSKGFIVQMGRNSTTNVALVKDGVVPFGELVFRPSNQIIQKDGVWTFADIRQADGKLISISVKVRGGGNW